MDVAMISEFLSDYPILFLFDDSCITKEGDCFEAKGHLFDHTVKNGSNYLDGHRLVKLLKMVPVLLDGKVQYISVFTDASHFVMGCDYHGYIYCRKRSFVTTESGRNRYNVLGGIDYVTKVVLTHTNDEYINAESVCALLKKIAAEYAGRTVYLILDNAKYQKCKLDTSLPKDLGIVLEYPTL